jgi:methyl-accepting chemotaxis protein
VANLADETAQKVSDTANSSAKANSMVLRGANIATSAIEKMENIFKGIESTRDLTITLEDKINNIPRILDAITHISRQTDILALNATIEASKAGEHGRGFALVAEEVRRLADNTKRSVEDIAQIVRNIKAEMDRVISSVSDGVSFIKEGREDIRKVRDMLGDITTFTAEVAGKASDIMAFTQKQKEKSRSTVELVEEVAHIAKKHVSITEEVDNSVEQNNKSMESALTASEKLSRLSTELQTVVSRFKLADNTKRE